VQPAIQEQLEGQVILVIQVIQAIQDALVILGILDLPGQQEMLLIRVPLAPRV
jgi:hypothetical protein